VNFVNVGPTAKIAALKSHTVDIISDFYNEHDLKVIEFGADLGYVNWKDIGLNPLRQFADRQRRVSGEEPETGRGVRQGQPEGLCRLRRRRRALPQGAARPGLGLDKENQQRSGSASSS
jgi:NitT/TauT family transport system substrate-binding protein